MNYKVGDEVVCIDAQTIYRANALVAGQIYKVVFLAARCVALDGVYPLGEKRGLYCSVCNTDTDKLAHFFPSRFIKLDRLTQDTEEEATA